MKRIFALAVALVFFGMSSFVFAAEEKSAMDKAPEAKPKLSFEEKKAKQLERMDMQMGKLKEKRACIEKSQNIDEMKACHTRKHRKHDRKKAE